jgi:hypothetical protein
MSLLHEISDLHQQLRCSRVQSVTCITNANPHQANMGKKGLHSFDSDHILFNFTSMLCDQFYLICFTM